MFDDGAGWVGIRDALTADEIAAVMQCCRALLAVPAEERATGDKPGAGTRHLFALERRCDVVGALCADSAVLELVHEILGPTSQLDQASYRCPQPGYGSQQLHADDAPKLDDGPARVATAIVALVDFTETNGATRVVPGSHRRPDLQRQSGSLASHPDEIALTGPAGTAFVFNGHLLHSGTENRSNADRDALQLTWRRT
ncbi:MAG: phytanoyl-CoA dioxygenase family protein [Actinomycetota bacterium]